jgi:UDP-N-acetylmuramate dehydrogenase
LNEDHYTIQKDVSLKPYNTFGVEARAQYLFEAQTMDDLLWIIHQPEFKLKKLIIGGGSNLLLTRDFDGLVIKISLKHKWIEKSEGDRSLVSVMAGENWHSFVLWCLAHDLGGLENLSLIPGNVGTAPIQNIGAYGVEIRTCFHHLEALNVESGEFEIFTAEDCQFGYRDSYFKNEGKDRYIIIRVFFSLTNKNHVLHTSYGAIDKELERLGEEASIHSISKAVVNIRRSKLPDPAKIGNSGSFFKNPVVTEAKYRELLAAYPNLVAYPAEAGMMKLAAGWMIDKAGWRGYRDGDAGVHEKQALVLVNYGNATGREIEALSDKIKASIISNFGVELEREVNLI